MLEMLETVQREIARVRGFARAGMHDRAAAALDRAMDGLTAARAALPTAPYAAAAIVALAADLDRATGGAA